MQITKNSAIKKILKTAVMFCALTAFWENDLCIVGHFSNVFTTPKTTELFCVVYVQGAIYASKLLKSTSYFTMQFSEQNATLQ